MTNSSGFCLGRGLPVMLVNRSEARNRVSSVVSDDDLGMRLAVDHLVGLGHRRVVDIAGPLSTSTGVLRGDGFERAIASWIGGHRMRGEVLHPPTGSRRSDADSEYQDHRDRCRKRSVGSGRSRHALKRRNLRCPEDVSIVGHNDMPFMDVVSPPLTTVRIEHREMGRRAARMLIHAIKTGSSDVLHVVLRSELIIRDRPDRCSTSVCPLYPQSSACAGLKTFLQCLNRPGIHRIRGSLYPVRK